MMNLLVDVCSCHDGLDHAVVVLTEQASLLHVPYIVIGGTLAP